MYPHGFAVYCRNTVDGWRAVITVIPRLIARLQGFFRVWRERSVSSVGATSVTLDVCIAPRLLTSAHSWLVVAIVANESPRKTALLLPHHDECSAAAASGGETESAGESGQAGTGGTPREAAGQEPARQVQGP